MSERLKEMPERVYLHRHCDDEQLFVGFESPDDPLAINKSTEYIRADLTRTPDLSKVREKVEERLRKLDAETIDPSHEYAEAKETERYCSRIALNWFLTLLDGKE